jgi:hypothetical protein
MLKARAPQIFNRKTLESVNVNVNTKDDRDEVIRFYMPHNGR